MKQSERNPLGFYTIGIVALFLAGFFLLVVFGARSYRDTVKGEYGNMDTRALSSYLATCVKGCDTRGAVSIRDTEAGPTLVVADGDTGFALRIYRHEGQLLEDFAALDAPLAPEEAQVIGSTEYFELERPETDLLIVRTDAGRVVLHLRSEGDRP